jgi:hypothetical protein
MTLFGISVETRCACCALGMQPRIRKVFVPYYAYHKMKDGFIQCQSYDAELRHVTDPFGWYKIAWWPVQCRNGYWRWLRWVEQHGDGTYSLGNRAH